MEFLDNLFMKEIFNYRLNKLNKLNKTFNNEVKDMNEFTIKFKEMFKILILINEKFKHETKLRKSIVNFSISDENSLTLEFTIIYNDLLFKVTKYISIGNILKSNIDLYNYILAVINSASKEIYEKIFFNTEIIVCNKCLRASCWNGESLCYESYNAGVIKKTIRELRELKLEHEYNWKKQIQCNQ